MSRYVVGGFGGLVGAGSSALISMSEAVVNSSPLLIRCVFVSDSSIFVTNIFSLILGISVAVLASPDGENESSDL